MVTAVAEFQHEMETVETELTISPNYLSFRTLDWGMDPLRDLVVELDFVRCEGGPVVATSISYFGYVGVLTGVRRGLSMSLNFRPHHDRATFRKRLAFRWHQLMVLFGFRRSISSVLRQCLLTPDPSIDSVPLLPIKEAPAATATAAAPPQKPRCRRRRQQQGVAAPVVDYVRDRLPAAPSTAAYLIFCTPDTVYSLEKDHLAGTMASSDVFLATYNHDRGDEDNPAHLQAAAQGVSEMASGMDAIVACSISRKQRVGRRWARTVQKRCKALQRPSTAQTIAVNDLIKLVADPHITNDETHYSVVMDPQAGNVLWRRVFLPEETVSG